MAKEYIEREATIAGIESLLQEKANEKDSLAYFAFTLFAETLKRAPAADVVEVVRCKNCEHLTKKGICEKFRQRYPFYPEADFHCGFGKKKEGTE